MKKAMRFMKKHPTYTASIHAIGGVGIGMLIASPLAGVYPFRFGIVFIIIAALGHIYAWVAK